MMYYNETTKTWSGRKGKHRLRPDGSTTQDKTPPAKVPLDREKKEDLSLGK